MLTLYFKQTCPYSQRVLGVAEELGVQFNLKNISEDTTLVDELIEKGGKKQVPFLVDPERDVSMYESNDIIEYLRKQYPEGTKKSEHEGLHVHDDGDACETCQ